MYGRMAHPFDRLTHLSFGIFLESSPEIPVIFASNLFQRLKTLRLQGTAYFDADGCICHIDYVLMLRSISAWVHPPIHSRSAAT